jgi:hypothetical protein
MCTVFRAICHSTLVFFCFVSYQYKISGGVHQKSGDVNHPNNTQAQDLYTGPNTA